MNQRPLRIEPEQAACYPSRGTYTLHFVLAQPVTGLVIGRLGCFDLAAGHYYYTGSALGAGGLAARLRRHIALVKRCHWHIDYLRPFLELHAIWVLPITERLECRWCTALASLPELSRPIPRFGATDTGCGGHLFYAVEAVTEDRLVMVLEVKVGAGLGAQKG